MQLPRLAAALFLSGFALHSSALTIGRPQGSALIGKPLDMVIPLTLDSSEPGDSLCLEAEVLQGDIRMPDRRVTVSVDPGPTPGTPRMHVRSTSAVQEPVVTLIVRAGCEMRSTRTYTLLADLPVEPSSVPALASAAPSVAPRATAPAPAARSVPGSGQGAGAGSGAGTSGSADARPPTADAPVAPPRQARPAAPRPPRTAAATPPARPRAAAPAPAPRTAERARPPAAPAAAVATGSRLQVDALDPASAVQGGLKTSSQLSLPAVEDPARRADAAAQWRALNADPEAAQREAQRLQALEATLANLRAQSAQTQKALLDLQSELAQARESRYRNPLVYSLAALLLLALIAIALLWRMARRAPDVDLWHESAAAAPEPPAAATAPRVQSANSTNFGAATFAPPPPADDDFDSGFGAPVATATATTEAAAARPVNTEELFDVQQQSDFFLSLGQHDQAIAVLREHIAANPNTSALAYLDLLRIFHSLDRRQDYAELATDFERAFNADVPDFEQFNESAGRGLEHYRGALARIEAQWPAPGTLQLIEELVFRRPGSHDEGAFDLAAYQELLLLYSVAKEVIDPDHAPPAPVTPQSFVDTYSHDDPPPTAPAALLPESGPTPATGPSIYGAIDERLGHRTEMAPVAEEGGAPDTAPAPLEPVMPVAPAKQVDLSDFDKTAYETLPAALEPAAAPEPAAPPVDSNLIDFELFDPDTEAEIAPRPKIIKR